MATQNKMNNPMNKEGLEKILVQVQNGHFTIEQAAQSIAEAADNLSYACLDHYRHHRTGHPEVIFGEGKSGEQLAAIFSAMVARDGVVLATRVSSEKARLVTASNRNVQYHIEAQMLTAQMPELTRGGLVGIISAGTSDVGVAEEARVTCEGLGNKVTLYNDIGVAGIHRMVGRLDEIRKADVLIVVAGMEGALPSVVAGLVRAPVIAVPTSIGYGTGFGGIAALLGMLNSCSPGIAVVNIDNGFGAACMADAILKVDVKTS
jgi:NCAIR mutase (PurE)-related protein